MAQLSTSLARKARAFTLAAASLIAIAAPAASHAGEIEGLPAQCKSAGDKVARLRCGSAYYQRMKKEAEAQSADARARSASARAGIAAANSSSQCIDRVMREAGDPKMLSSEQKAKFRAKVLACG